MSARGKVVEAIAEWDDPDAFRVFLIREDDDGGQDDGEPMEAVYTGDSIEQRLFMAAVLASPKDFVGGPADRELGWATKAAAQRVAKAVNAEVKRIKEGAAPPDPRQAALGLEIASIMRGKRR